MWIDLVVEAIRAGHVFETKLETIAVTGASFDHRHKDASLVKLRTEAFVRERIAYLAHHRAWEVSEYIERLPEELVSEVPPSPDVLEALVSSDDALLLCVAHEITKEEIAEVVLDGLRAGRALVDAGKEGIEVLERHVDQFRHRWDGDRGKGETVLSEVQMRARLQGMSSVVDGIAKLRWGVFRDHIGPAVAAVSDAQTLRAYLTRRD